MRVPGKRGDFRGQQGRGRQVGQNLVWVNYRGAAQLSLNELGGRWPRNWYSEKPRSVPKGGRTD